MMNYTKTIREYCLQNVGRVFDVSYEYKKHFSMVPYKTFLKILNRLEEDEIIKGYSKGIYIINSSNLSDDPIVSFYANNDTGLVVGYDMYNKYNVTSHKQKPTIIYTNAMETTRKNIGDDYILILFDVMVFCACDKRLIEALEILENGPEIIGLDTYWQATALIDLLQNYNNLSFEEIIKAHKYKYSTICTMTNLLEELHINNRALEIYHKVWKND